MQLEIVINPESFQHHNPTTDIRFFTKQVRVQIRNDAGEISSSINLEEINEKTTTLFAALNANVHPVKFIYPDKSYDILSEEETINFIRFLQRYIPKNKEYGSIGFIRELSYQRNSIAGSSPSPDFIRCQMNFNEKSISMGAMVYLFDPEHNQANKDNHYAMYIGKNHYLSLNNNNRLMITTLSEMQKAFYKSEVMELRKSKHMYTPMTESDRLRYFLRAERKKAWAMGLPMPVPPAPKKDPLEDLSDLTLKASVLTTYRGSHLAPLLVPTLLHPFQRALYLSIKNSNSFFTPANFARPFQGLNTTLCKWLTKSIIHRASFNLTLEIMNEKANLCSWTMLTKSSPSVIYSMSSDPSQFYARVFTSGFASLALHPITTVKYYCYTNNHNIFGENAFKMGLKKMINTGFAASLSRDLIFAGSYFLIQPDVYKFIQSNTENMEFAHAYGLSTAVSAGIASVFSSPLNYIRLKQFASLAEDKPLSISQVLKDSWANAEKCTSSLSKLNFFRQQIKPGMHFGIMAAQVALSQLCLNPQSGLQKKLHNEWSPLFSESNRREYIRREKEKEKAKLKKSAKQKTKNLPSEENSKPRLRLR